MPALKTPPATTASASQRPAVTALAELIALRLLAGGGATRAELARDLRAMTLPELAPAAWRAKAEIEIAELIRLELVSETRGRLKATPGSGSAANVLGGVIDPKSTWAEVREGALTATALGLDASDKATLKALANADNLRALIVQQAFGLGDGKPMSLSKLRASLAVRALERAFGNQIKSGLGAGGGLAPKPSRLLAGQLSKAPRDYGSDGRLIAALAAEHLGTANAEAETLRASLLRRYFEERKSVEQSPPKVASIQAGPRSGSSTPRGMAGAVANDRGDANTKPLPAARPDLAGFIKHVQAAAAKRAEGWPGNRKAFICHVWQEIKSSHPAWALSEIEFKGMLAEAHRAGGLILANADLKDKKYIQEFENSAIQYKNTVWHFVRVEEA